MSARPSAHVRETDAFTLSMERDPLLRSTIVAVARFDRVPSWDAVAERIERATRLNPTFRQRLVSSPLGLAPPRWVDDPDFDLGFHLRRVAAPEPATLDSVLVLARNAGMAAFDPARPLWEFTLVEGLEGGQAALVMKVHHSLTDGIGGIQIANHVIDLQREAAELGPLPELDPVRPEGPLDAWVDTARYNLGRVAGTTRARAAALPRDSWRLARHPFGVAIDTVSTVAAIARFARPITSTRSPVMTERRLQWHYATLDVPLRPLKAAAKRADATLNDGFVPAIAAGLRRYHDVHGATVDDLCLTMPVSTRTADDPEGGNRVTIVRFTIPVGIVDPLERMREVDRRCDAIRHDRALPWSNAVAGVLNLLPRTVTGSMLKHVDVLASDVPGFTQPVYVAGAELTGFYPFGPTIGSSANITLMSYRDTCNLGVNTDAGAVPDPDLFVECLREGFEEVLALAGEHEPVRIGVTS
jgi:diacylglycerol O-acyltransferase